MTVYLIILCCKDFRLFLFLQGMQKQLQAMLARQVVVRGIYGGPWDWRIENVVSSELEMNNLKSFLV